MRSQLKKDWIMKIFRISALLVFLSAASGAFGQETPDFTGVFELNVTKGQNLGMVAAIKETVIVAQTADNLTIDFTDVFQGNTTTRQVSYDLSGEPVVNYAAMGEQNETVSNWLDNALVTTWTSEGAVAGTKVVRTETRTLSSDGQTMAVETVRGDRPSRVMVYDRTQ